MCQQKYQMECLMWAGKGAPAQSWPHIMEFPPKTMTMFSKATEAHWDFRVSSESSDFILGLLFLKQKS